MHLLNPAVAHNHVQLHKIPGTAQELPPQTHCNHKPVIGSSDHQGQLWSCAEMPSVALRSPFMTAINISRSLFVEAPAKNSAQVALLTSQRRFKRGNSKATQPRQKQQTKRHPQAELHTSRIHTTKHEKGSRKNRSNEVACSIGHVIKAHIEADVLLFRECQHHVGMNRGVHRKHHV